jgi:lipoprotein-anchoring transpeptidase ErfK/SrfK
VSPARTTRALSAAVLLSAAIVYATPSADATLSTGVGASPHPGPPNATQAWVAKVVYTTVARSAPSVTATRRLTVSPVSPWGTTTELLVLGTRVDAAGRRWVRVRLDYRPNGFAAWIDAEDTILHRDPWRISVSRERRAVRIYRADRLVRTFAAVVGKPSTPTPTGLFAVAAELPQPDPGEFEGSWVLPLTAHSGVLRHFDGGDGQIALHGRGGASLIDPLGSARSHGCVRLANQTIGWIATHMPVGTPVRIS